MTAIIMGIVTVAPIAALGVFTVRYVAQDRLDRSLIAAAGTYDYQKQKYDSARAITLLDQGADPNTRDIEDGDAEVSPWVRLLKWFSDRSHRRTAGQTILQTAVEQGQSDLVAALLSHGADPNAPASDGSSLLVHSMYRGDDSAATLLLRAGATDVNGRDPYANRGGSAVPLNWNISREPLLCWAAQEDHIDIVRMLLDRGANVDAADDDGRTALHWAVYGSKPEIVRLLVKRSANVMARDRDGHTPLWVAKKACAYRADFGKDDESMTVFAFLRQAGAKE